MEFHTKGFKTIKKLALAILALFGSSYSRETLFSHMKSNRNCFGLNISAACLKLKTTNYQNCIKALADKM